MPHNLPPHSAPQLSLALINSFPRSLKRKILASIIHHNNLTVTIISLSTTIQALHATRNVRFLVKSWDHERNHRIKLLPAHSPFPSSEKRRSNPHSSNRNGKKRVPSIEEADEQNEDNGDFAKRGTIETAFGLLQSLT
jgi:hypothetical protein